MSEINELTSLVGEMASMRERMATQEAELTALRSQVAGLGQGHSVAGSGLSLERVGAAPASRRKMLKLGAAAAAVGALGLSYVAPRPQMVLAADGNAGSDNPNAGGPSGTIKPGPLLPKITPTSDGNAVIVGGYNTTQTGSKTWLYNNNGALATDGVLKVANYTSAVSVNNIPSGYYAAITGQVASATSGIGVYADSVSGGYGLWANSDAGSAATFSGESAMYIRANSSSYGPFSSASSTRGTIWRDTNGDLYYCVAAGTPGTWRRLTGASTAGSLQFASPPQRLTLATGVSGAIGNSLQNNVAAPINIRTRVTNAGAATGVIGVATVYAPGGSFGGGEYVLAAPGPSATQGVVLTASPGQNKSSAFVMVGVDASGVMSFNLQSGTNNTAMTFDVFGFYS